MLLARDLSHVHALSIVDENDKLHNLWGLWLDCTSKNSNYGIQNTRKACMKNEKFTRNLPGQWLISHFLSKGGDS